MGDNPAVGFLSNVGRAAVGMSSLTNGKAYGPADSSDPDRFVLVGLGDVLPCKPYFLLSSYPYVFISPLRVFVAMHPETRRPCLRFAGFPEPNACYGGLMMLTAGWPSMFCPPSHR